MNLHVSSVTQQGAAVPAVKAQPAAGTRPPAQGDAPSPDKVTLGGQPGQPLTYADPRAHKAAPSELASMLEESERKAQAIIDLVRSLVEQQGLDFDKVASGAQRLRVDPATVDAARAAIADGGEFSVQKTAERILSFAKAAIGDDPSRLDAIRAAVEKGFQQAQDMLGGTLPEISQKTHDLIRSTFDRWKSEGIPAGDKVSLPA